MSRSASGSLPAIVAALATLGLGVPAAGAATVSVHPGPDPHGAMTDYIVFEAAPGERNVVRLDTVIGSPDPGSVYTDVSDVGTPPVAGAGCEQRDPVTVRCAGPLSTVLALGDGDDELTATHEDLIGALLFPEVIADGGAGDDRLTGGDADVNELHGGEGNDRLTGGRFAPNALDGGSGPDLVTGGDVADTLDGGGGVDVLRGGAGDDVLTDGDVDGAEDDTAPGRDVIGGGPGRDEVSYAGRTEPVFVDLGRGGGAGEPGEGDLLRRVESVTGGAGDDRLAGNGVANVLDGLGGHDRLVARGGRDRLRPGGDALACGRGRDVVSRFNAVIGEGHLGDVQISARDFLRPDCETVQYSEQGEMPAYPTHVGSRRVAYPISCPLGDGVIPCAGTLTLREERGRHRLLARGSWPERPWVAHTVVARLTRAGRRLASRRHGVRATVRVTGVDQLVVAWSIRLRVPRW